MKEFNENELNIAGTYESGNTHRPVWPKYDTPITPRENYLRYMRKDHPLWQPTQADVRIIAPAIIKDNPVRGCCAEMPVFDPVTGSGGEDMFGVNWIYVPKVDGSMIEAGKPKVADIENWEDYISFPDLKKLDWKGVSERNKGFLSDGRANTLLVLSGLFERLISFVDMADALIALIDSDSQPAVRRLFERLCEYYDEMFTLGKEWLDLDQITFHDDWGSARAPLFSLELCREMIVPYLKRIVDSAHRNGLLFELHCCGQNELLVPAMIECGVDIWCGQPINNKAALYEQYGDQIVLGIEAVEPGANMADTDANEQYLQRLIDASLKTGKRFLPFYPIPESARKTIYRISRIAFDKL